MEFVEEISQQVQLLKKKLAWSWVYDSDRKLDVQNKLIEKLKGRIPTCQARIDQQHRKMEELSDQLTKKKSQIANMMERTSEVRRMKEDLQHSLSMATKERLELEGVRDRKTSHIQKMVQQVKLFEQQIHDIHEQHIQNTQAEENEMEERLKELQFEVDEANAICQRLKAEEDALTERLTMAKDEIRKIASQIEDTEKRHHEISSHIRELQMHQTNQVTAFGGGRVIGLLQAIERHQHRFKRPPIGPIGAHVNLEQGDMWSTAIENAVGRLLNAFVVTDHKDSLVLRACAREANYNHLQIIIYEFSRPRLNIPTHMLPQTNHPTVFSIIQSGNPTVLNVLVDVGNVERLVLVRDYDIGKTVAFDQRISNLKEVYTSDGYKMFSRGSAQTILPPSKNARGGRLCGSYDNQLKNLEKDALKIKEHAQQGRGIKRNKEEELSSTQDKLHNAKRRRMNAERELRSKEFELQDVKKSISAEASSALESTGDELHQELSMLQHAIQEKEDVLEKLQMRVNEAGNKANDLKASFESLCESAKTEIDALAEAERVLMMIEKDLRDAEAEKKHFENVMSTQVLSDLNNAEAEYRELQHNCTENRRRASIICPESEIEALGGSSESNPEQLSAQLSRMNRRLQRESQRFPESIEDLRMLYQKKERKILRKRQITKPFEIN